MFSTQFLLDLAERAAKSAAQATILAIGAAEGFDLFAADWRNVVGIAAGAAVLSALTSLASEPFGTKGTASAIAVKADA
jgi:hypothetical protein